MESATYRDENGNIRVSPCFTIDVKGVLYGAGEILPNFGSVQNVEQAQSIEEVENE